MRACFRVHGTVQGVGYRRFVAEAGRELGLAGWVRNDPAGTVTGEVEGSPAGLEAFRAALLQGPPASAVGRLDWNSLDVGSSLPHPFELRR